MRGDPQTMTVLRPLNAEEAVSAFTRTPHAVPIAGGTDFMVTWNIALSNHKTILDLSGIDEWTKIQKLKDSIRIGSLVTHTQLREHPLILKEFPLLAQACSVIGGLAIQNRGTLGGNIANASPAGDTFPALAVYNSVVHTTSLSGRRSIPLLEIFAGVKKTSLKTAELIEAIEIPIVRRRPSRQVFRKVGTRAAQALSKTVAAGLLWLSKRGEIEELRFALGSVAPTVRRLKTVEAFARGRKLDKTTVPEACQLLAKDVSPIDDIRSTREYRLRVSQNILRTFLAGK